MVACKISILGLCHLIACPIWIHIWQWQDVKLIRSDSAHFKADGCYNKTRPTTSLEGALESAAERWKNTPETKMNRYGLPKVGTNITETAWSATICRRDVRSKMGMMCRSWKKIEQASWSMLENHKRCSCKIWKNIANIKLLESLSNTETRG